MARIGFLIGIATAILVLAGCGDSPGDGNLPQSAIVRHAYLGTELELDVCGLVTSEEVGEATGENIVEVRRSAHGCTYESLDSQASSVTIEINRSDSTAKLKADKKATAFLRSEGRIAKGEKSPAGDDVNTLLSGMGSEVELGDEAFFGANERLNIRKGDSYITIAPPIMHSRTSGGNPLLSVEERRRMALEIARKVLIRLPG